MKIGPVVWQRIALVLTVLNVGGAGYAALSAEPWHAATHAALAVGFGLWAQQLRHRRRYDELRDEMDETLRDPLERLAALEGDVTAMQQELSEAQERLDFAERLLTQQRQDPGRLGGGGGGAGRWG